MKTNVTILLVSILAVTAAMHTALAQGTAFTYQGRLNDASSPATGSYDLTFSVWNALSGPSQIGATVTNLDVSVTNGLFTVTLDFGTEVFTGGDRWLEIGVRTNGAASFTPLDPRQRVTAAPYAITAGNLTGVVSNQSIGGTYSNAVSFDNPANQFAGSFSGNGSGLSNVNAQTLGGLLPSSFWTLAGNAVAPGQFLGSTNDQPVEIRVNGWRALRLEPNTNGAPNIIGGSPLNQVDAGVVGAVIGGGGVASYFGSAYSNRVSEDFSVIGGGGANTIEQEAFGSVIAGGFLNTIRSNAFYSSISGGSANTNAAFWSTIAGGDYQNIDPSSGFSFIGGGGLNTIQSASQYSVIGGGRINVIQTNAGYSFIGGGQENAIEEHAGLSVIGGGWLNRIHQGADQSVIAGGNAGKIFNGSREAFIGGGFANTIGTNAGASFIGAGIGNTIGTNSIYSTIAGGQNNSVGLGASHATIGGGTANTVGGAGAFIGGGYFNRAENFDAVVAGGAGNVNAGYRAFIGSGENNVISNSASYATIGGGRINVVSGQFSVVAGGANNIALGSGLTIAGGVGHAITNAVYSTVGGGINNELHGPNDRSTIAGGSDNRIGPFGFYSTIAGGWSNAIFSVSGGAIGGGLANRIGTGANYSFVGGGQFNTNAGFISLIGGGQNNTIEFVADRSVIAGGGDNRIIGSQVLDVYATIGGGRGNSVQTNVQYATIPGGLSNSVAASYSFAAGRRAKALHDGAFVWADSTDADFTSTATNQFSIRAMGGLRLETAAGSATLNGQPIVTVGGAASSNFWQLGGNNVGPAQFLGSTNNRAVEFRANGTRALRLEPNASGAPNIIGGSPNNFAAPGVVGATIGGGGATNFSGSSRTNRVVGEFGTVAGGAGNTSGSFATSSGLGASAEGAGDVAMGWSVHANGGFGAVALGYACTASGTSAKAIGYFSQATADYTTAMGSYSRAVHPGSFVWADTQSPWFDSTANDQFSIRAQGGVRLETGAGGATLNGQPILSGTVPDARLSANVALLDRDQTFTGQNTFVSGGGAGRLIVNNHSLAAVDTSLFTGLAFQYDAGFGEGAIMSSYNDGVGSLSFWTKPGAGSLVMRQMIISRYGDLAIDQANNNNGFINNATLAGAGLTFGTDSGEGIASKRTPGGNQFGLDFYTGFANRMSIHNNGNVTIHGNVALSDPTKTIQFPATSGANPPMIAMFPFAGNSDRMVLAHSLTFSNWGLQYQDSGDRFNFLSGGTSVMAVDLGSQRVGIGRISAANRLEVAGNASKDTAGDWLANSDRRIKTNITTVSNALEKLDQVRLVQFRYTDTYRASHPSIEDRPYLNVVAQEFAKVFPDHVKSSGEKLPDGKEILQVDTYPLTIYSAAAIQELDQKVNNLKTELDRKESENCDLKRRLEALEKIIFAQKTD
jgi:hypothetical protein